VRRGVLDERDPLAWSKTADAREMMSTWPLVTGS
jgi:hypothetical protein